MFSFPGLIVTIEEQDYNGEILMMVNKPVNMYSKLNITIGE